MRILLSPRFWMSIGIMCLSVASASGCRSSGMGAGPGWFSWMNPKPASGALATTPPTKPSVAMLPNPSSTTGASTSGTTGTGAAMASYPGSAAQSTAPVGQTSAGNYYNTGPYAMSGQSGLGATAGSTHSHGSHTHSAASATPGASTYGGYQSPYANSANNTNRMADSRSNSPAADQSPYRSNPYSAQGVAPAANTSTDQWNRSATFGTSANAPATFGESAASRSYGESQAEQPMGTAGSWTPPAGNSAPQNNYLDKFQPVSAPANAAPATNPATRRDSAPYRPGSTNRNGATLPATLNNAAQQSTTGAPAPSYPTSSYPTTSNYPSSSYPASAYPSSSYPTSNYPPSAYPSADTGARAATSATSSTSAYPTSGPIMR